MSTHEFIVTVDVDDWLDDPRDPGEYARIALNTASLPDARRLDGYADMEFGSAMITGVEPL